MPRRPKKQVDSYGDSKAHHSCGCSWSAAAPKHAVAAEPCSFQPISIGHSGVLGFQRCQSVLQAQETRGQQGQLHHSFQPIDRGGVLDFQCCQPALQAQETRAQQGQAHHSFQPIDRGGVLDFQCCQPALQAQAARGQQEQAHHAAVEALH